MKYLGGKHNIVRYILPYVQAALTRAPYSDYVEPFVGGANVIMYVRHPRKYGFDKNHYLIALYNAIKAGWAPPEHVDEATFLAIKQNKDAYPPELVAFVGIVCSYGAVWFRSYAHPQADGIHYARSGSRQLVRQKPLLDTAVFAACSYDDIALPRPAVLYCDPPYKSTERYTAVAKFDSDKFFEWCREQKRQGHTIFVSEYAAPSDFRELWTVKKRVTASIRTTGGDRWHMEKLFTL
jgi:DNA adenine methylase